MKHPLPHIAFQMQEQIPDGIFMIAAAMPDLLFRQLAHTAIDRTCQTSQALGRVRKEVIGNWIGGHPAIVCVRSVS